LHRVPGSGSAVADTPVLTKHAAGGGASSEDWRASTERTSTFDPVPPCWHLIHPPRIRRGSLGPVAPRRSVFSVSLPPRVLARLRAPRLVRRRRASRFDFDPREPIPWRHRLFRPPPVPSSSHQTPLGPHMAATWLVVESAASLDDPERKPLPCRL
jgi:hypothetical protein